VNLWLWLASPAIGLMLGLFGAGGGMLTVPLLMYGAGVPLKQAIAASIWIVGGVSLIAALQQRAWRVIQPGLLVFFSIGGIIGGILGAWVGSWIAASLQQLLFGILLIVVSVWTWRVRLHETHQPAASCHCVIALFTGTGMGLLTGLLGVGGGFLMVPTLIALGISHFPTAVAHSLILISVNAAASGITYLGTVPTEGRMLLLVGLLATAGSFFGSHLLKRIPRKPLQRGFSAGLALLGITMLIQLLLAYA
jgi:uncharacterized membrane protein YfcA